jgi:hypothetical protein
MHGKLHPAGVQVQASACAVCSLVLMEASNDPLNTPSVCPAQLLTLLHLFAAPVCCCHLFAVIPPTGMQMKPATGADVHCQQWLDCCIPSAYVPLIKQLVAHQRTLDTS